MIQFFAAHLFQILKEGYLKILEKPSPIFCFSPFSNIKKSILTNLKKDLVQFFADHLFSTIKKSILTNVKKKLALFFADHIFQILKKEYLHI